MKRKGRLFDEIADIDNLRIAFHKAAKGKKRKKAVKRVEADLDNNLQWLHDQLVSGKFHTSSYRTMKVHEPKERTIYVLPFWPDRVVQHAILNVLEPYWDSLFIRDSYSCRKGYGHHRGSKRTEQFVKHYKYVYKADIHHFYPSLNHDILKGIIRRKIKDRRLLDLLDDIIDSVEGETNVPIGNLVSQWFGNLYLNELDKFVKQELHCKAYIRYCDDFVIFGNDPEELDTWRKIIESFVSEKLKLEFSRSDIFPTSRGVDFLGYRHFPEGYLLVRKSTARHARIKLKEISGKMDAGTISPDSAMGSIESIYGMISWANSYNFQLSIGLPEARERAREYAELFGSDQKTEDQ